MVCDSRNNFLRVSFWQVSHAWKISMSVKGSLVSQESSASTALAPMAVAHAPRACWEMGQHVQVSMSILCICKVCYAMLEAF